MNHQPAEPERTIGEAAELLGVTSRTLRHWDHIGLLQPSVRSWSDYRFYTAADLERAMQILVYRSAGVALKEIAELLDSPADAASHLQRQRELLVDKIGHLHRMVRAVDELIEQEKDMGKDMSMAEKIELFGKDWPGYQEEAEQRWGDTPEWEQSRQVQQNMTKGDWIAAKEEMDAFTAALADAASREVAPGSQEGDQLALRHRGSIGRWYEVSPSKQVLLARMYVSDERFNDTYQGHAAYLLTLVESRAEKDGVDLSAVEWE